MILDQHVEQIVMGIIANAGASRTTAFTALEEAKKGSFENASELLKRSEELSREAHVRHSELLSLYSDGKLDQSDLLIAHAQDHLMCAELARELIAEIIELRETLGRK